MNVFWERGYAATSLTDLTKATGMNRPSLYAAFGDKHSIFLKTLHRFGARMAREVAVALADEDLERALTEFYLRSIDVYMSGTPAHRGCMVASAASVDAVSDAEVRVLLLGTIEALDAALTERFRGAVEEGALTRREASQRGRLATAVLHSLSVRARAGQSRRALRKFARESVAILVGEAS